jgi:hypothetical protein
MDNLENPMPVVETHIDYIREDIAGLRTGFATSVPNSAWQKISWARSKPMWPCSSG